MWYTDHFRRHLCDMHIDDWNPEFLSKFDYREYVSNLKRAHVNSAMIYLQSHVGLCYFPTKFGKMHKAYIGREDTTSKLIALCKDEGIAVTGYYSVVFDNYASEAFPAWRMRDKNGRDRQNLEVPTYMKRYGLVCPNNQEYRQFTKNRIQEMAEQFPNLDGLFFDMLYWPMECRCPSCQARWKKEVGGLMPTAEDYRDPKYLTFMQKRREWMGDFAAFLTATAKAYLPNVSVQQNVATIGNLHNLCCSDEVTNACDYVGGDIYKYETMGRYIFKAIPKNAPFEYMFSRAVPNLAAHTQIKSLDCIRSEVLQTTAHHGASLVIDAIDPIGTMDARVYDRIGIAYAELERYEPYFCGKSHADVGIYYSIKSKFALHGANHTNYQGVATAIDTMIEANIPACVKGSFSPLDDVQVLLAPMLTTEDEADADRLVAYVKNGGTLYFSGGDCPALLRTFFSATVTSHTQQTIVYVSPNAKAANVFGDYDKEHPIRFDDSAPITTGIDKEKVIAHVTLPYTDRTTDRRFASIHSDPPAIYTDIPAMAFTEYGKGRVVWSALPFECIDLYDDRNIIVKTVEKLLKLKRTLVSDAPKDVELTLFTEESSIQLCAVLHNKDYQARRVAPFDISLNCHFQPSTVTRLPDKTIIPSSVVNNQIRFECKDLDIFAMYEIK